MADEELQQAVGTALESAGLAFFDLWSLDGHFEELNLLLTELGFGAIQRAQIRRHLPKWAEEAKSKASASNTEDQKFAVDEAVKECAAEENLAEKAAEGKAALERTPEDKVAEEKVTADVEVEAEAAAGEAVEEKHAVAQVATRKFAEEKEAAKESEVKSAAERATKASISSAHMSASSSKLQNLADNNPNQPLPEGERLSIGRSSSSAGEAAAEKVAEERGVEKLATQVASQDTFEKLAAEEVAVDEASKEHGDKASSKPTLLTALTMQDSGMASQASESKTMDSDGSDSGHARKFEDAGQESNQMKPGGLDKPAQAPEDDDLGWDLDSDIEERKAAFLVRRAIQKVRVATPETYDKLHTELIDTMQEQVANLGDLYETVVEETEKGIEVGKQRWLRATFAPDRRSSMSELEEDLAAEIEPVPVFKDVNDEEQVLKNLSIGIKNMVEDEGENDEKKEKWNSGLGIDLRSSSVCAARWKDSDVQCIFGPEDALVCHFSEKLLFGFDAFRAADKHNIRYLSPDDLFRWTPAAAPEPLGLPPPLDQWCCSPVSLLKSVTEAAAPPHGQMMGIVSTQGVFVLTELLALLICWIRDQAEDKTGETFDSLILSTHASFGLAERRTLHEATVLAGFQRTRLLRAPVSAALWLHLNEDAVKVQFHVSQKGKETILNWRCSYCTTVGRMKQYLQGQLSWAISDINLSIADLQQPGQHQVLSDDAKTLLSLGAGVNDLFLVFATQVTLTQAELTASPKPKPAKTKAQKRKLAAERALAPKAQTSETTERQAFLIDIGKDWFDCAHLVIESGIFEVCWAGGDIGVDWLGNDKLLEALRHMMSHGDSNSRSQGGVFDCFSRSKRVDEVIVLCDTVMWGMPGRCPNGHCLVQGSFSRIHTKCKCYMCEVEIRPGDPVGTCLDCDRHCCERCHPTDKLQQLMDTVHLAVAECCGGEWCGVTQLTKPLKQKHLHACGAALQGAILGAGHQSGPLQNLMMIDSSAQAIGIGSPDKVDSASSDITWIIHAHQPIPTTRTVIFKIVSNFGKLSIFEKMEGKGPISLGYCLIPTDMQNKVKVCCSVGTAGQLQVTVPNVPFPSYAPGLTMSDGFWGSRIDVLQYDCLQQLSLNIMRHKRGSSAHSRRESLSNYSSCSRNILKLLAGKHNYRYEMDETPLSSFLVCEESDDEDLVRPQPDPPPGPPPGHASYHQNDPAPSQHAATKKPDVLLGDDASTARLKDSRGQKHAEVLRQKLEKRKKQTQTSTSAASTQASDFKGVVTPAAEAEHDGPSTSNVCTVCLSTEAELGKSFPFVLEKCGHKCICKPCLRKIKSKNKQVEVECPLCRTRSKPVLAEKYSGNVFTAELD